MIFSIIIVMFPTTPTTTAQDMNYTCVVAGGWLLLCIIYYYFPRYGGLYWFKGPLANIELDSPTENVQMVESASYDGEKGEKSISQE